MNIAVQMNTRIDGELKRRGDEVLARCGYSPSQAVRCLWEYAARNDNVPEFMARADVGPDPETARKLRVAREGSGLGLKLLSIRAGSPHTPQGLSAAELACPQGMEEDMYEAMLDDMSLVLDGDGGNSHDGR